MSAQNFENLDLACAKVGKQLADQASKTQDQETDSTKDQFSAPLAVLEEQGVYALFLYLKPKQRDSISILQEFLTTTPQKIPLLDLNEGGNILNPKNYEKLANNLDNLLLAQNLLRRALTYARYHAKTLKGKAEK